MRIRCSRLLVLCSVGVALVVARRVSSDPAPRPTPDLPVPSPDSVVAIVQAATRSLPDTAAARAAGFAPLGRDGMLDLTPVQGQHWVHRGRMRANTVALDAPPVLMYVPIEGSMQLVGVAFAERGRAGSPLPTTLAGVPASWHAHVPCGGGAMGFSLPPSAAACRAQGGQPAPRRIAMVHVWLNQPSPDGPFAHMNPALPFLAAGVPLPAFHAPDAATRTATNETMLALGDTRDMQLPLVRRIVKEATPADRAAIDESRARLREAAAAYGAVADARDASGMAEAEAALRAAWQQTRTSYLDAASPRRAAMLARQFDAITAGASGHEHGHDGAPSDAAAPHRH